MPPVSRMRRIARSRSNARVPPSADLSLPRQHPSQLHELRVQRLLIPHHFSHRRSYHLSSFDPDQQTVFAVCKALGCRGAQPRSEQADDSINGTNAANILGARGGDDVVRGLRSSDSLYGNTGEDRISGGMGEDELHGGYGNDTLYSADDGSSRGYRDVVYCGHGGDFASIDPWDRVMSDCEEVR